MVAQFEYLALTFEPYRKFLPAESALPFAKQARRLRSTGIRVDQSYPRSTDAPFDVSGWDHKRFYAQALAAGCPDCDLFYLKTAGRQLIVCPGENELWEWIDSDE